jgi:cell division protein FtsB
MHNLHNLLSLLVLPCLTLPYSEVATSAVITCTQCSSWHAPYAIDVFRSISFALGVNSTEQQQTQEELKAESIDLYAQVNLQ